MLEHRLIRLMLEHKFFGFYNILQEICGESFGNVMNKVELELTQSAISFQFQPRIYRAFRLGVTFIFCK